MRVTHTPRGNRPQDTQTQTPDQLTMETPMVKRPCPPFLPDNVWCRHPEKTHQTKGTSNPYTPHPPSQTIHIVVDHVANHQITSIPSTCA